MRRRTVTLGLVALPLAFSGCASTEPAADPLIGGLTSSLGVTENQAMGGVGSILTLAQEKLASGQFDQVASVIPDARRYLDMARSLGAVTGPIGNRSGLTGALGRLGISPTTTAKFVPAVTDFVGKAGGSNVASMLSSALQ
jgi:Protein of unknown function VcgC/VcgE (DUF2780)